MKYAHTSCSLDRIKHSIHACGQSCDISHPIGSTQIPLEHTKTVQEFPDLLPRAGDLNYIPVLRKEGLVSRLDSLIYMKEASDRRESDGSRKRPEKKR